MTKQNGLVQKRNGISVERMEPFYQKMVKDAPFAFAYHKIILDEEGKPVDYIFLDVNDAYENFTGLKRSNILQKPVSEVIPNLESDNFKWIKAFGEVALNQQELQLEEYSEVLNMCYKIHAYSPEKYHFVTFFTDITERYHLTEVAHTFNQYTAETIDYQYIASEMRKLSGASYVAINKFGPDGKTFTTKALSGIGKHIQKSMQILGFKVVGKEWKFDPYREALIKDKKTTFFEDLSVLTKNALPEEKIRNLRRIFNLGQVVITKTTKNDKVIGDFTLIFSQNESLKNRSLLEGYADLVGSLFSRIDTEDQLKTESERYLLSVNGSNDGIWDWYIKENSLFFSDRWKEQIGYQKNELPNEYKTVESRIHPDDKKLVQNHVDKYLSGKSDQFDVIFRFRHKDGTYRWIRSRGKGIANQSGDIIRMSGSHTDITDQKKMEEEVKRSERNFRLFFKSIKDMLLIVSMKGEIVDANDSAVNKLKYSLKELQEMKSEELRRDVDRKLHNSLLKEIISKGQSECHLPYVSKDERIIQVDSQVWIEKWNNEECIFCLSKDITAEEEALQKFNKVFHKNPAPMIISTFPEGKILEINTACLSKTGYQEDELVGKRMKEIELFTKNKKSQEIYRQLLVKESVKNREVTVKTKYNNEICGLLSCDILYNQGKKYLLMVMMDITPLKEAEENARQANKAKSQFLANMSHEIRTPLNAVIGFTDLLQKSNIEKKYLEYIKHINTAGNTLLSTVNDILDFSKIEEGKLEIEEVKTDIINITEETADIIKNYAYKKGIELILNIDPDVPRYLTCDPLRVKQILTNLVSNAVKFTEQGEVEISLQFAKDEETEKGNFHFSVRDTGIGISDQNKKLIFEAFAQGDISITRKYGGTGLGLVIAENLAKKMGSNINLSSEENHGSTFSFTLLKDYQDDENVPEFIPVNSERILIITKSLRTGEIIRNLLNRYNTEAVTIQSLENEILELENLEDFSAVLIDETFIQNSIHSAYLKRLFKSPEFKDIKLIVLTAKLNPDEESVGDQLIDYKINKPIKHDELLDCLRFLKTCAEKSDIKKDLSSVEDENNLTDKIKMKPVILTVEDFSASKQLIHIMISSSFPDITLLEAENGVEAVKMAKKYKPEIIFMDIHMPLKDGYNATREIKEASDGTDWQPFIVALTADITSDIKQKCKIAGMDDYIKKPFSISEMRRIINQQLNLNITAPEAKIPEADKLNDHHDKEALMLKINGNETAYKGIVEVAMNQIGNEIEKLEKQVLNSELEEVIFTAHSIKGLGLNLYFNTLADAAKKIELQKFSGNEELKNLLQLIKAEYKLLKKEVSY